MKLPSKELLSEVCGENVKDVELWENNSIRYFAPKDYILNIYELAHKCKEWAFDKGYIIEAGVHPTIKKDRSDRDYFYKITTDRGQILVSKFDEIIKTEPEAIFKACELVLEKTKCGS